MSLVWHVYRCHNSRNTIITDKLTVLNVALCTVNCEICRSFIIICGIGFVHDFTFHKFYQYLFWMGSLLIWMYYFFDDVFRKTMCPSGISWTLQLINKDSTCTYIWWRLFSDDESMTLPREMISLALWHHYRRRDLPLPHHHTLHVIALPHYPSPQFGNSLIPQIGRGGALSLSLSHLCRRLLL